MNLHESLSNTLDKLLEGCQVISHDFRYLYLNDTALIHARKSREELLGKTMMEAYPGIEHTTLFSVLRTCLKEHASNRIENKFVYPDGSSGWFDLRIDPVAEGLVIFSQSLTVRKALEEYIMESEERFRALVEASPETIVHCDTKGVIKWVNRQGLEMFHVNRVDDAIGRFLTAFIVPEEHERSHRDFAKLLKTGKMEYQPYTMVRANGTSFRAELSSSVIYDTSGKPKGILGIAHDISGRERLMTEIYRSWERYRLLWENIVEAIYFFDPQSRGIIESNPAFLQLLGYTADEVRQLTIYDIIVNERQSIDESIRTILRDGWLQLNDRRWKRKDGSSIDIDVTASVFKQDGRSMIFVVARDVTERKALEAKRLKLEEELQARYRLLKAIHRSVVTLGRAANMNEVFETTLSALESSLNIARASILLFDTEGVMRFAAWRGLSESYRKAVEGHSPWTPQDRNPKSILVSDVDDDATHARLHRVFRLERIRSLAFIPLMIGNRLIGKFMIYYDAPHTYRWDEVEFLTTLAGHVAFAVDRQRTYDELVRSEQEKEHVLESLQAVIYRAELEEPQAALWISPNCERVSGFPPKAFLEIPRLWESRIHPDDKERAMKDFREAQQPGYGDTEYRWLCADGIYRWFRDDFVLIQNESMHEVEVLGTWIDITKEKQIRDNLEQSLEEIRLLSRYLTTVRDEEKAKIARDLHDEFGQALTGIRMEISSLSSKLLRRDQFPIDELLFKCSEMTQNVETTLNSIRRFAAELHPDVLDKLGLKEGLDALMEEFGKRSGIHTTFKAPVWMPTLGKQTEIALYRIAQESLTNVARHAAASNVIMAVERRRKTLMLEVRDDGKNTWSDTVSGKRSLGIIGMRERARSIGADFELIPSEGTGTTVRVIVPLKKD